MSRFAGLRVSSLPEECGTRSNHRSLLLYCLSRLSIVKLPIVKREALLLVMTLP